MGLTAHPPIRSSSRSVATRCSTEQRTCGVCAIDLTSGNVVALLRFETAAQEVFAVTVLAGRRYPDLINDDEKLLENSFTVPDARAGRPFGGVEGDQRS